MKKIVLTGGGTAGHIFPALALVDDLKNYQIFYIGSNSMEKEVLKNYKNIKFFEISAVKLERKLSLKNLLIPFKLHKSICEAKKILQEIKPDVIFSKGGYVSLPVVFAGKKLHITIVSHESDLSMGLANKMILKKCNIMCVSFPETCKNNKCVYTGQPIRKELLQGKSEKYSKLFSSQKPILLIIGGSQGAKFINEIVWSNIDFLSKEFNIIHIVGKNNLNSKISNSNYKQFEFIEDMGNVYASTAFAISRAGCGVISELKANQIPSLLIPLSKKCSRGDQIENARLYEKSGFSLCMEEEEYSKQKFIATIKKLILQKDKLIANIKKDKQPLANEKIIEIINNLSKKPQKS